MANLTFTLPEVIALIKLNTELPKQIGKINIVENRIKLRINIGKFIPNFNVFVSFHSFENGMIKFKIDFGKMGV